jgi:hypothetical protein
MSANQGRPYGPPQLSRVPRSSSARAGIFSRENGETFPGEHNANRSYVPRGTFCADRNVCTKLSKLLLVFELGEIPVLGICWGGSLAPSSWMVGRHDSSHFGILVWLPTRMGTIPGIKIGQGSAERCQGQIQINPRNILPASVVPTLSTTKGGAALFAPLQKWASP